MQGHQRDDRTLQRSAEQDRFPVIKCDVPLARSQDATLRNAQVCMYMFNRLQINTQQAAGEDADAEGKPETLAQRLVQVRCVCTFNAMLLAKGLHRLGQTHQSGRCAVHEQHLPSDQDTEGAGGAASSFGMHHAMLPCRQCKSLD